MARYEGELKAVHEVGLEDVFANGMLPVSEERQRREAIACCLSASEGWKEAIKLLRGAFAPEEQPRESGLTSGKAD